MLRASLLSRAVRNMLRTEPCGEVTGDFHREFLHEVPMACPAQTLIPRQVAQAVGPFRDSGAQDYDYYLRIAQRYPVTVHADSLVRWRYRPETLSGPQERRFFVYGLLLLDVLAHHAPRCTADERAVIRTRRERLVRDQTWAAYDLGRDADPAFARRVLRSLVRAHPWPPRALPYLLGLTMPAALRESLLPVYRGVRRWVRTWVGKTADRR